MAGRYEVEVTVVSARNLKNVNWRNGDLMPYAALWVDTSSKCSTKVAVDGDGDDPLWDEKLVVALPAGYDRRSDLSNAVLHIDVVHANAAKDVKPLVGSARLPLAEVLEEAGLGVKVERTLKLKRPSGRPQGKLEIRVCVRETSRYYEPAPPYSAPYGQQQRDPYGQPYGYAPPPPGGYPYGAPPPQGGYAYGAPPPAPGGYAYGAPPPAPGGYAYGAPPPSGYPYGGAAYGQGGPSYGAPAATGEKKSKFGMGTGLAVGAAAGVLGGLALAEGFDYVEDKIADDVAEKVEDDLGYDDGDY